MSKVGEILDELIAYEKNAFDFASKWEDLIQYLQESEQQVIELIEYLHGHIPKYTPKGDIEFGLVLHWLEYPPPVIKKIMDGKSDLDKLFKFLWEAIAVAVPKSNITPTEYSFLADRDEAVPGPDGTLFGKGKYEQLDELWAWAVVNFALNEIFPVRTSFGNDPYNKPISNIDNDSVRIAIVGDWGTGIWDDHNTQGPAVKIMAQVKALNPHPTHVIHLGDVYYAGTDLRPPPEEEQENFVNLWWGPSAPATSFTLNSNHEMYGDGSGYFDIALKKGGAFEHQNQTSYFALGFHDWVILGLDSALCSENFYMNGRLYNDKSMGQLSFIQGLNLKDKRIIVLTHHNGMDFTGLQSNQLWTDVQLALSGNDPNFWYWGHVHNGVAYNHKSAAKTSFVRCAGHSAIPFGNAWSLEDQNGNLIPAVDYYAKTQSPVGPPRVRNGFVVVTITKNATTDTLTEEFYEQGNPRPVWGKTHTY